MTVDGGLMLLSATDHSRRQTAAPPRCIAHPLEGGDGGRDNSGADIDAVGAISSRSVQQVPEPQTAWLLALGLAGVAWRRGRPASTPR